MDAINYPRTYAQTGEIAAFRPVRRLSRDARLNVQGHHMYIGGERARLFGTSVQEASALWKDDDELRATLARIVSDGYNFLRIRGLFNNSWSAGSTNWGLWKYEDTDPEWSTVSNRWLLEEDGLIQLDKLVAWSLDMGIEALYIDNGQMRYPVVRHSSQHAPGTYLCHGMWWSTEFRDIMKEHLARVYHRVNTINGVRYSEEPRMMMGITNEDEFGDSYKRSTTNGWGGNTFTATSHTSTILDGISSTAELRSGMSISGTALGIPTSTTIASVDSASQVTLSQATTLSATNTATVSCTWFFKLVEDVSDTTPILSGTGTDNGYWYDELNTKFFAWAAATYPSWIVPNWGRAGAQGFPKQDTWTAWASGADPTGDKQKVAEFWDAMEYESAIDMITWARTYNPDLVVVPHTFGYSTPRACLGLPAELQDNICTENHTYFPDGSLVAGVRLGSVVTRKSIMDSSSSYTTDGGGWAFQLGGTRASYTAHLQGEVGQYGPSRWRYQRLYYEMLLAQLHEYEVCVYHESQTYQTGQAVSDGRYMNADHANVGSPCSRLTARALAPAIKYGFLSAWTSSFTIYATEASVNAYQRANLDDGYSGVFINTGWSGSGFEHGHWGGKKIFFDIDENETPTVEADFSAAPKVTDATRLAGHYVVNTGDAAGCEKLWMRTGNPAVGYEVMTPYMAGMIDTITASPTISLNPVKASSLGAAVSCAVCFLRSDGLYPLFTGPMKLYIHGSDYDTVLVTQGGGPGEAAFKTTDGITLNYATGQNWLTGGDNTTQRLMMPEAFTLTLETTNNGLNPAGTDLEIFGVNTAGIPIRLASTYDSGTKLWSFAYAGTYPEYIVQPKVAARVRARRK